MCVLDYEPQVPPTVSVVPVCYEHAALAENGTHFFNPKTKKIVPYPEGKHRDSLVSVPQQTPKPTETAVCIPLNTSSTPEWAKGDLIFSYECVQNDSGVLSVINNTGFTVLASASTNVGQFTEVAIDSESRYCYECKYSDSPMGFLMFRATSTKKR